VVDIFAEAKMQAAESFRFFEAYLAVALIYWLLIIVYSYLQQKLENYLDRPYRT